ncbi:MAG: helix-turn-helix transcriptional regulator [Halodesulfurarchaeum sp.]
MADHDRSPPGEDGSSRRSADGSSTSGESLFSLGLKRNAFLSCLVDGPAHKRDLIACLDRSRSTIDRGLAELAEADLVTRRSDGSFRTSQKGRLLYELVTETIDTTERIEAAGILVSHLSREEPPPPAVFADADVRIASSPNPVADASVLVTLIERASRMRALSIADHEPAAIRTAYRRSVLEESLEYEVVFVPDMIDRLLEQYPQLFERSKPSPNASIYVTDSLPFGLFLLEVSGSTHLVYPIHDKLGVLRGLTHTTDPRAVDWADSKFERYRRDARDVFATRAE